MFQSTHPHGVRLLSASLILINTEFQSTHPHGVRPPPTEHDRGIRRFQSTHPHGVRPSGNLSFVLIHGFQSTHPHGVRLHLPSLIIRRRVVSIHAPTRGATSERHKGLKWLRSFNPRTHTGCDTMPSGVGAI